LNEMGIPLYYKKVGPPPAQTVPAFSSQHLTSSLPRTTEKVLETGRPLPPQNLVTASPKGPPPHFDSTQNKIPVDSHLPIPSLIPQVAGMSWAQIEAHLQTCRACDLGQNASMRYIEAFNIQNSNTVQRSNIDWLIVSDSPKRALDGSVLAFSESSLALFNAILKHLLFASPSLAEKKTPPLTYLITHTVKCLGTKLQAPADSALQTCLVHLKQQIKLLQPQLILVMGQAAAHALLHDSPFHNEPVGQLRSKLHHFENTPMIVTYSPEQMTRSGEVKSSAWTDLCWAHSLTH
jgi:DNA polymerase